MTTLEILNQEFESIKQDLILRHEQLGMRSSGQWENELETTVTTNGDRIIASIVGTHYTEQLVYGRKPGKFPPIKDIERWIYEKGIKLENNIKLSSLAFLIARKIAKEGTTYFRQGGTDLIESVITPERIQQIINKIKELNITTITKGLIEQLKKVA